MFMHEAWPTNEMIPSLHRKVVQQALKGGVIKKLYPLKGGATKKPR
jgi:hypothetical protein